MAAEALRAPQFAPPSNSLAASAMAIRPCLRSHSDISVLRIHWEVRRTSFHALVDSDFIADDRLNSRWATIDRAERAVLYTEVESPQVAIWRVLIAWAHSSPSSDLIEGLIYDGDIDGIYAARDHLNWSEKMLLATILQLSTREG